MKIKKALAFLVSLSVLSTPVLAVPIQYTFSTGPMVGPIGAGVGLLPSGSFATGSFIYDSDAPFLQPGASGVGAWYSGAISDFMVNIGSYAAQDSFGYAYVVDSELDTFLADGTPHSTDRDFIQFYLGPSGGSWFSTPLGGSTVARIRFNWLQSPIGADFIDSESLLPELPNFAGTMILDIGPLLGTDPLAQASGYIGFTNLRATRVPEPESLSMFFAGILGMVLFRRRRTLP